MTDNNNEKEPILTKELEGKKRCFGNEESKNKRYRYVLMFLVSLVGFGDYFCYDCPASLEDHILNDLGITESQYMFFYSSTQWIQVGVSLFGGYLVDKVLGIRLGILLGASVMTLTQSLFAGGAMYASYWTMVVARMLYGAMSGVEWVSINKMNAKWFKDKELSFATGLKVCLGRLGTVASMNLMNQIYTAFLRYGSALVALGLTLFAGAIFCFIGAVCAVAVFFVDRKAEASTAKTRTVDIKSDVRLRNVTTFPVTYWLVVLQLTFYHTVIFSFVGLGQVFFERKYGLDLDTASVLNSLAFIIGAVAMPIMGTVVDKVGMNLYWMFGGMLLQLACHLLLTFTFVNPYVSMTLLGLSYTFITLSAWPLIPYTVDLTNLGTAYGIVCASQALSDAGGSYLAGYLAEYYGYIDMEAFLIILSCVSTSMGCLCFVIDRARAGNLNLSTSGRLLYEEQKEDKMT